MSIEHTLLILDDRADVRRGVQRFMSLFVSQVFVAGTPEEAEAVLREHAPEFLLCDYWLGPEHPPGTALVERWRHDFPCLARVALMTGTKATAILPAQGVDRIFQKPLRLAEVKDWFLGDGA
ncbi:MAG: response regulator [Myxococcales bacterium]|nr:response regulator [Myxococcales bacterium]